VVLLRAPALDWWFFEGRSDDGGDHWRKVNEDERYRQRAWYFTHIFADPKNADTVYVLNTPTRDAPASPSECSSAT